MFGKKNMKIYFVLLFALLIENSLFARWQGEDFRWHADTISLNAIGAGNSTAYCQSIKSDTAVWYFNVHLGFSPSANNQIKYFLFSDDTMVSAVKEALYFEIGENGANDGLSLFQMIQSKPVLLTKIGGGSLAANENNFDIVVYRSGADFRVSLVVAETRYDANFTYVSSPSQSFEMLHCRYTSSNVRGVSLRKRFQKSINWPSSWWSDYDAKDSSNVLSFHLGFPLCFFDSVQVVAPSDWIRHIDLLSSSLNITLTKALEQNRSYVFKLGLNGPVGKVVLTLTYISRVTLPGVLVLNEILFKSGQVDYLAPITGQCLELKNEGARPIDLEGITLCVNDHCHALPDMEIKEGEYLVLTEKVEQELLGRAFQWEDWLRIPSDQACLSLKNERGYLMDKICFDVADLQKDYRENGGYTIERSEEGSFCSRGLAWCDSFSGNTLGFENQAGVFSDSLRLEQVFLTDSNVELSFTQPLNLIGSIEILPSLSFQLDSATMFERGLLSIDFQAPLTSGVHYTLRIRNFKTFCGESIELLEIPFGELSDQADGLILNEIMFDPLDGMAEYLELYNSGEAYIDLSKVYLGASEIGEVLSDEIHALATGSNYVAPKSYHVFHSDKWRLQDFDRGVILHQVHPLNTFPSLLNSGMCLQIVSSTGGVSDSLCYETDWHNTLAETKGVALERMELRREGLSVRSWSSASSKSSGGSPTRENSNLYNSYNSSLDLSADYFNYEEGLSLSLRYNTGSVPAHLLVSLYDSKGYNRGVLLDRIPLLGEGEVEIPISETIQQGAYIVFSQLLGEQGVLDQRKEVVSIR